MVKAASQSRQGSVEPKPVSRGKKVGMSLEDVPRDESGRFDVGYVIRERFGGPELHRGREGKLQAFLEYRDYIKGALAEGYTTRQVWLAMTEVGLIRVSYSCFAGYVKSELGGRSKIQFEAASAASSAEVLEPAGSEGREIDERVHELVGKSVGKPAGKPAEKPAADPHAGIKFGAGAGQKPFDPSGG